MGRAEFNKACQLLQLDRHLVLVGGGGGLVAGMGQLFHDLSEEHPGGHGRAVDEEGFVRLFHRIEEEERRHDAADKQRRGSPPVGLPPRAASVGPVSPSSMASGATGAAAERRHEQPPLGAPAVRSERLRLGGRNRR